MIEHLLLEYFLRARKGDGHGVVCFGPDTVISDRNATRLLAGLDLDPVWERQSTTARPVPATIRLDGADGRAVVVECRALDLADEGTGSLVLLRSSTVSRPPAPSSLPDGALTGLVGSSGRWRQVEPKIAQLAGTDGHALITGEGGTGKLRVALGVVAVRGLVPMVFDTLDSGALGAAAWLQNVAASLRQIPDDSMVVVARLERLEPAALEPLAEILDRRSVPSLATAVGPERTGRPRPGFDANGLFANRVHLPALRHRLDDLEGLARHFDALHGDGGLTWTPDALDVMGQYLWPGNVKELEQVVEAVLRRLPPTAAVRPDALPDKLRRSVRRRPLTRLEEAEVDVILNALAEAQGNKDLAAHLIGIHRATLYRKLQNYGLD